MRTAALIYPHQLFYPHPTATGADAVFLIEEPLFFRQYTFHRQKLILHRASMKRYLRERQPRARYIEAADFPDAPGRDESFHYPTSAVAARAWLEEFLNHRFAQFGAYEDAISTRDRVLFHSVLTPALNIGLLSPREIVDAALRFEGRVPMNSLEGFIRQVIVWREFVRLAYRTHGRRQRSRNFWNFTRPMPAAFYTATTGIGQSANGRHGENAGQARAKADRTPPHRLGVSGPVARITLMPPSSKQARITDESLCHLRAAVLLEKEVGPRLGPGPLLFR
jgi:deoxyribodipyrimidine photolyase-like uncharacterized protein